MNNNNYYSVQGWMVNELNLSGIDLQLFAIIYGFSQDNSSMFEGSLSYLQTWTKTSKPTLIKSLKRLVERGLLDKISETKNNITFNKYKHSLLVVKFLNGGSKETLMGGGKETLPNNIIINNIDNNKEPDLILDKETRIISSNTDYEFYNYIHFYNSILKYFEFKTIPNTKPNIEKWLKDIKLLVEKDGHPFETINKIIIEFRNNSFWRSNFNSILKLRRKDKDGIAYIDRFISIMKSKKTNQVTKQSQEEKQKNPNRLNLF